jgi:folate-dependent phosphoribosylglycinamide formyltransferase PurN
MTVTGKELSSEKLSKNSQEGGDTGYPRVVILTKRSVMSGGPFVESIVHDHNVVGIFAEERATSLAKSKWQYARNRLREHGFGRLLGYVWRSVRQRYLERECVEIAAAENPDISFFRVRSINDPGVLDRIASLEPDIISIGSTRLFCDEGLSIPPLGCLNIHGAMLPRNAGMEPTFWALYNEEFDAIGETIHFAVAQADAGGIVMQEPIPFALGETIEEIDERIIRRGAEMIPEAIRMVASGEARPQPMDMSNYLYNGRPTLDQRRDLADRIKRWRSEWRTHRPEPKLWV